MLDRMQLPAMVSGSKKKNRHPRNQRNVPGEFSHHFPHSNGVLKTPKSDQTPVTAASPTPIKKGQAASLSEENRQRPTKTPRWTTLAVGDILLFTRVKHHFWSVNSGSGWKETSYVEEPTNNVVLTRWSVGQEKSVGSKMEKPWKRWENHRKPTPPGCQNRKILCRNKIHSGAVRNFGSHGSE